MESIDAAADWVLRLMDELGIGEFEVLGHSMGGYIAAAMCVREPERITGLTLLHSTALGDTVAKVAERNKAIRFVERNGKGPYLRAFVRGLFAEPKTEWVAELDRIVGQVDERALLGFVRAMRDRPSRLHALRATGIPTAYITGALDSIVLPERNEAELKAWPEAESVWFPRASHMAMYESGEELLHFIQTKSS